MLRGCPIRPVAPFLVRPGMITIILGVNQLSGPIPDSISTATSLTTLVRAIKCVVFAGAVCLAYLELWFQDLRRNMLTGTIPSSISSLSALTTLYASMFFFFFFFLPFSHQSETCATSTSDSFMIHQIIKRELLFVSSSSRGNWPHVSASVTQMLARFKQLPCYGSAWYLCCVVFWFYWAIFMIW
jgi:hypothetical protein